MPGIPAGQLLELRYQCELIRVFVCNESANPAHFELVLKDAADTEAKVIVAVRGIVV